LPCSFCINTGIISHFHGVLDSMKTFCTFNMFILGHILVGPHTAFYHVLFWTLLKKLKLYLSLIKQHNMKMSGGLKVYTEMVSFMSCYFIPWELVPGISWIGRWVSPRTSLILVTERSPSTNWSTAVQHLSRHYGELAH
jgi:hypothetical protein